MRTLIASLVAPLVVVLGVGPLDMLGLSHVGTGPGACFLIVIYAIAFAVTVLVGLPIQHASRRWHFSTLAATTIAGSIAGVSCLRVTAQAVGSYAFSSHVGPIPTDTYLKFGLLGAVCGLVFWLIARQTMRPDTSLRRARGR